jgi:glycosyltransferase involved in cell wall biosynthesis
LALTQSERGRSYEKELNGVRIRALGAVSLGFWYPGARATLFPSLPVRQAFHDFSPDLVHIQDHYPISQTAFQYARKLGLRVIGTNHFMPENLAPYLQPLPRFTHAYRWTLWRWMLDLFNQLDLATAPSRTAASILRQEGLNAPVYPVSCGVDLNRFRPIQHLDRTTVRKRYGIHPDKAVFLFVGRVDGEKRLDVLIQAMALTGRNDVQLAIAGKGAALKELKRMARGLNLGEKVHFTGFVPDQDLAALLNSADAFAMPSEAELLSIATLEAMACGKPALVAQAQALPELVSQGINGFLFHKGDPADAASCMERFAAQRERWADMGAASLAKAQAHGIGSVIQRYEELYEMVLGGRFRRQSNRGFTRDWLARLLES